MIGRSYQIARLWGVSIRLHVTLVLILPFLAWQFPVLTALMVAVGLFASIIVHELAHALVATGKGCRVHEILLLPIGGVAQMDRVPERALDEFLTAVAGPAVSALLFIVLYYGGAYVPSPMIEVMPGVFINILQFCGIINAALAVFNLMPALPMDGGRILRATLTPWLGRLRATRIASRVARVLAVLIGVFACCDLRHRLLTLAIAVFVYIAAGIEYRRVRAQEMARQFFGNEPLHGDDAGEKVVIGPAPHRNEPVTESRIERIPRMAPPDNGDWH